MSGLVSVPGHETKPYQPPVRRLSHDIIDPVCGNVHIKDPLLLVEKTLPRQSHQPERERERNVLFNDALNTFYLRLYGVRHMVKDHSDSEKGNLLPPHRLLLSINSKGSFICTIPQTG